MTQEQIDDAHQENNQMKEDLKSIIEISRTRKIEELYSDSRKFYLFHSLCVSNVIFKVNWKKHRCLEPYYNYTDESDEAFAFLALLNNANRIEDMVDSSLDKSAWRQPLFTEATNSSTYKNGRTNLKMSQGKGWTNESILLFATLQESISKFRVEKKELMEKIGRDLLRMYEDEYGKKKTAAVDDASSLGSGNDDDDKRKREENERKLDAFFRMTAKRRCIGDTIAVSSDSRRNENDDNNEDDIPPLDAIGPNSQLAGDGSNDDIMTEV